MFDLQKIENKWVVSPSSMGEVYERYAPQSFEDILHPNLIYRFKIKNEALCITEAFDTNHDNIKLSPFDVEKVGFHLNIQREVEEYEQYCGR